MCTRSLGQSGMLLTQAELSRCMRPSVQPAATRVISPLGSNVILRCDATGYPTPTLTWIKTSNYMSMHSRVTLSFWSDVTDIWVLVESCCDLVFCTDCCQQDILDNSEQLPRILESCKSWYFVLFNKYFNFIQCFTFSCYLQCCMIASIIKKVFTVFRITSHQQHFRFNLFLFTIYLPIIHSWSKVVGVIGEGLLKETTILL